MNYNFHDDDMWFALEQELTNFDSYISDKDWISTPSQQSPVTKDSPDSLEMNVGSDTYEQLMYPEKFEESVDQIRLKSRQDRIEAIKQLYNQVPTIISASSLAKTHRIVNSLYKKGKIRQANKILQQAENLSQQSFIYIDETPEIQKTLQVEKQQDDSIISVEVWDKKENDKIVKTFESLLDAIKYFLK